jgi:pimeloyl-ACP methyl ester carboxylesterase
MLNEQIYDLLKFIQCPVLVLYGEKDQLIPNSYFHHMTTKSMAEKAIKEIPQARLIMIPLCGHFVFYEKPEMVNDEIKDFLDN